MWLKRKRPPVNEETLRGSQESLNRGGGEDIGEIISRLQGGGARSRSDFVRHHLIVPPEISRAIRAFGLDRTALVRLLNHLRSELENHADNYKHGPATPGMLTFTSGSS